MGKSNKKNIHEEIMDIVRQLNQIKPPATLVEEFRNRFIDPPHANIMPTIPILVSLLVSQNTMDKMIFADKIPTLDVFLPPGHVVTKLEVVAMDDSGRYICKISSHYFGSDVSSVGKHGKVIASRADLMVLGMRGLDLKFADSHELSILKSNAPREEDEIFFDTEQLASDMYCRVCGSLVNCVDNSIIFGESVGNGIAYVCATYPACDGYCLAYDNGFPMGDVSGVLVRELRSQLKARFSDLIQPKGKHFALRSDAIDAMKKYIGRESEAYPFPDIDELDFYNEFEIRRGLDFCRMMDK